MKKQALKIALGLVLVLIGLIIPLTTKTSVKAVNNTPQSVKVLNIGNYQTPINNTLAIFNNGDEIGVGYSYYDEHDHQMSGNYSYMIYPFNIGKETVNIDYYTIFFDFIFLGNQYMYNTDYLCEIDVFNYNTNPFTTATNTYTTMQNIDNQVFNYYLRKPNNIESYGIINTSLTYETPLNYGNYTFIVVRMSNDYLYRLINQGDLINDFDSTYTNYLGTTNGFIVCTAFFNPTITFSTLQYGDIQQAFNEGIEWVENNPNQYNLFNIEQYNQNYDSGYNVGYGIGYNAGYNVGYQEGAATPESIEFISIMRNMFTTAGGVLNTELIGGLKLIHFILIPLVLGLFVIILKIFRS